MSILPGISFFGHNFLATTTEFEDFFHRLSETLSSIDKIPKILVILPTKFYSLDSVYVEKSTQTTKLHTYECVLCWSSNQRSNKQSEKDRDSTISTAATLHCNSALASAVWIERILYERKI